MSSFIAKPHLPQKKVTLAAVSALYPHIIHALRERGTAVVEVAPNSALTGAVASHADMLLHHLGGREVVVANGEAILKNELEKYGFHVIPAGKPLSAQYPDDVALNAARVGKYLFCREKSLEEQVAYGCQEQAVKIISVRQGYAKCSTAVIDNESIITADPSIAKSAAARDLNVLQITPGSVKLDGFQYGFLGGACGLISKHELAFTGKISEHPDYQAIQLFCSRRGIELISLTNQPLIDVGSIIPLMESE